MASFFLIIGDLQITGADFQSLDKDDPMPTHFTVTFVDLPTGQHHTVSCAGEVDQLSLLADWIWCDDDDGAHARCVAYGLTTPFLP